MDEALTTDEELAQLRMTLTAYRQDQIAAHRMLDTLGVPAHTSLAARLEHVVSIEHYVALERRCAILFKALDAIDRHIIGACGDMPFPDPCDECVEMREIAEQALAQYRELS